ncbi:Chlorophyll a-b binding protein P4, chloroplastic [Zea mays]|uniref:Chlorophyll a-b binding protein, chloroplastic n=2 Tax=Zea mays TaxID=4577 RepID=A0A3L6F840_MAIZE|nr:Chlorophyll a-b binding protein P4, chloroplastic [Zea mays]
MASVTARAPVAALRPSSSSAFLGHSSRLGRTATASPTRRSLKAEAKGEWLPGLPSPAYLDGRSVVFLFLINSGQRRRLTRTHGHVSLPGDNGFDPLGLAEDPENLRWYVQAELVNGRWAMLGVAGMLIPEVLTKAGLINAPQWYDAGKSEYFASSSTLFVIEFILFHYVEIRRWQDIKNPGSVNQDPIFKSYSLPPHECGYPGSVFNPLNFAPTLEAKEKELANGRLAMLAFLAFLIQHNVTGKGPFDNLLQHLSDPWHNTIIQTLSG